MGLHLLHLTSRRLHSAPQKKTTCHCLIYGLPCVTGYHLGKPAAVTARFFQGREKYFSFPLLSRASLSRHFHCDLISMATPFHRHPHPKVGPNPLSSLKAGRQAGNNWLKVTSSGLRGRLELLLPPECLPFFAFIVREQLLCTWTP